MKQRKLAPLLSLTMSLQLVVAPVAVHAEDAQQQPKSAAEQFQTGINTAKEIWTLVNSVRNPQPSAQTTYDMQMMAQQQTPTADKYFSTQKLSQIPGLGEYLAKNRINPQMLECKTLPTTLHEIKAEVCELGIDSTTGNPEYQRSELLDYRNAYFQINKQYRNYTAISNSDGQLFGVGCMKNAQQILNGFFAYRLNELDKLKTNIEKIQDDFQKASRSDLDAIEESVAVLEGGDSEMTNKIRSKRPDLFDFSKRFNNPACNSMFDGESFNKMGRGNGLNSIGQKLKEQLTQKNGRYSGEDYTKSHETVVKDIESLADKVAVQSKLRFSSLSESEKGYNDFLKTLGVSVSSTVGANDLLTPDIFSDVQTKWNESNSKLVQKQSEIQSELMAVGADPRTALSLTRNLNASNFDQEIGKIERSIQNNCVSSSNVEGALSSMFKKSASDHANSQATNFLRQRIEEIMTNKNTSLETKMSELQALKSSESDYYIRMSGPREVEYLEGSNLKKVKREGLQSPISFFSDTIKNCQAQYKVNKLNSNLTGSSAIANLRKLKNDYNQLAQTNAAALKQAVKSKLINCSSAEDANNSTVGSCTPERFNTQAPGFCANAALSCSKNMQACNAQAEKYVTEIKTQKTARVNNYKALVEKNKLDIIKIFDSALSRYMQDGEKLRGIFGAGFSSPDGIQREVNEGDKYLSAFREATSGSVDGQLLLEDPEKFTEMFKKNVEALKRSVQAQQEQIAKPLTDHIAQTEKNYGNVVKESASIQRQCETQLTNFENARRQSMAEAQKKQTELGEKKQQLCALYQMADINPNGACSENIKDIYQIDPIKYAELKQYCLNSGNEDSSSSSLDKRSAILAYCASAPEKYKESCTVYETGATSICPPGSAENAKCSTYDLSYVENNLYALAKANVPQDQKKEELQAPDAPAYCNAGNNTGRNSTGNPMVDAIMEGVRSGTAAARQ